MYRTNAYLERAVVLRNRHKCGVCIVMTRALIDCSNLHVGGGVQVAVSVVAELRKRINHDSFHSIILSSEVAGNLHVRKDGSPIDPSMRVMNTFGLKRNPSVRRFMDRHTVVLTIFGPLYRWRRPFRSIVGFAQPWIIYPRNECYARLPVLSRLTTRLKFKIQGIFFKRADELIVELEHVKKGLVRELGIAPERIHVIHNCLSSIYLDEHAWKDVALPEANCDLRLGFVGRNYLHKNTAIFPAIVQSLRETHGIETKFYVTFTDEEWHSCRPEFRDACINVGPLLVSQCPAFYRSLDGVVFPSLLECFSATPLEAMAMEKPLFASDRPFNREVCQEHAHYFDPLVPQTAAEQIAKVFADRLPDVKALRIAREHAIGFASPRERAEKYLALLRDRPI